MPYPGMPGFNPELQNLANGMANDYSGAGMPGWPGYPPLGPGMVSALTLTILFSDVTKLIM